MQNQVFTLQLLLNIPGAVLKKSSSLWKSLTAFGKVGLAVIIVMIILAAGAPYFTWLPYNVSSGPALVPPGGEHLMGTDELGVDLWSQICYGARVSLLVGMGTALLAGFGGGVVGIWAGYRGGMIERFLMRLIDVMIMLPDLPIMVILAAFFGSSLRNIIIVLALFSWSHPARIVRAQVLSLKEQGYIKMAKSYGAGDIYIIFKHFLPELIPILTVSMIRLSGMAIVTEAGLSFLGLGDPTSKSWGLIINHALNFRGIYFTSFWKWWLMYPWVFLTVLIVSMALFGRDLERIADPRIAKGE